MPRSAPAAALTRGLLARKFDSRTQTEPVKPLPEPDPPWTCNNGSTSVSYTAMAASSTVIRFRRVYLRAIMMPRAADPETYQQLENLAADRYRSISPTE